MPAERSDRIEQLYHAARERGPDERATFLQQACAGDEALRREVESLLAEDADVRSFLETPALEGTDPPAPRRWLSWRQRYVFLPRRNSSRRSEQLSPPGE